MDFCGILMDVSQKYNDFCQRGARFFGDETPLSVARETIDV